MTKAQRGLRPQGRSALWVSAEPQGAKQAQLDSSSGGQPSRLGKVGDWGRRTRSPLPPQRFFLQRAQHSVRQPGLQRETAGVVVPFSPAYEENWVRPGRAAARQTGQQAQDKSRGQEFFSWEERHGQNRVNDNATVPTAPKCWKKDPPPLL